MEFVPLVTLLNLDYAVLWDWTSEGNAVGGLKRNHRICSSILGDRTIHGNLRNIQKIMAYKRVCIYWVSYVSVYW